MEKITRFSVAKRNGTERNGTGLFFDSYCIYFILEACTSFFPEASTHLFPEACTSYFPVAGKASFKVARISFFPEASTSFKWPKYFFIPEASSSLFPEVGTSFFLEVKACVQQSCYAVIFEKALSSRLCRFLLLKLLRVGRTLLCWGSPATGQVSCGMIQSWPQLLVIPLQVTGWLYRAGSEGAS